MDVGTQVPATARTVGVQMPRSRSARGSMDDASIRVCYLLDDLGTGGTESQLLSLIRHLDRSVVSPHLCLLRGKGQRSRSYEPDDCPVRRLGVGSLHHPKALGKLWSFARFLQTQRIDVLQIYFQDSTLFGVLAGRMAAVPRILTTRVNLAVEKSIPRRWLARLCTQVADGVVANSQACRDASLKNDGSNAGTIHVIANSVDRTRLRNVPPLPDGHSPWRPQRVGLLANLRPVKDPGTFVQAAREVISRRPEMSFHLAGDGELRASLEDSICRLGLGAHVFLRGDVKDVPAFLAGIDIGVLCSRSEGSPNAVLEYMAAGRAVVATAVGGSNHLIQHGMTGLLVPSASPSALAAAILRLVNEPGLAARLGTAASREAAHRHDPAWRAIQFEKLYARMLNRP